jgi:hypothetical protein
LEGLDPEKLDFSQTLRRKHRKRQTTKLDSIYGQWSPLFPFTGRHSDGEYSNWEKKKISPLSSEQAKPETREGGTC